jgi:uncharacterized protein (UPF0262 family)
MEHDARFTIQAIESTHINGRFISAYGLYLQEDESLRVDGKAGPFTLSVRSLESAVELAFKSDDGTEKIITLPARPFLKLIRDRIAIIDQFDIIFESGTPEEKVAINTQRTAHHNESARTLAEYLRPQGITMDFETTRNLFGVITDIVEPLFKSNPALGAKQTL